MAGSPLIKGVCVFFSLFFLSPLMHSHMVPPWMAAVLSTLKIDRSSASSQYTTYHAGKYLAGLAKLIPEFISIGHPIQHGTNLYGTNTRYAVVCRFIMLSILETDGSFASSRCAIYYAKRCSARLTVSIARSIVIYI